LEWEGWSEEWKKGIIVPIVKKGEEGKVEEYRGIMMLPTLYKLYVMILAEQLIEEIEGKGIVQQNQTQERNGDTRQYIRNKLPN